MPSSPGFVVGGGPSLRGFDFNRLRGHHCLAVNMAFLDVPWSKVAYIGDARLLSRMFRTHEWKILPLQSYTRAKRLEESGVRKRGFIGLRTTTEWGKRGDDGSYIICDRGQAGLSAVNLAELLGYDPIFLLGFDCKGSRRDHNLLMGNYHDRYPKEWSKSEMLMTKKFTEGFEAVKDDIRAKVYNCSPDSALECFEKITFDAALLIATLGPGVLDD